MTIIDSPDSTNRNYKPTMLILISDRLLLLLLIQFELLQNSFANLVVVVYIV